MKKQTLIMSILGATALTAVIVTGGFNVFSGASTDSDTNTTDQITLKLHQFLPPQSTIPAQILDPWADKIEAQSAGRIKIDRYPSMQLGGSPPELIDQAIEGISDIIMTVIGYTPGRFPSTEVFELPFMMSDASIASCAFSKMFDESMTDEFKGVKVLGTWVHGPGHFHTKDPVNTPEDLNGMKIRGGSRMVNELLQAAGAVPVGMPVPAVSEALSKGVIDGSTIPWEVTTALKIPELVENHTEFEGDALYTLTFALAMNEKTYNELPEDLKAIIDENSGLEFSINAGMVQQAADKPARDIAEELGNNIITVKDTSKWRELVDPLYDDWIKDVSGRNIDGKALIERAQSLMSGECKDAAG